MAVEINALGDSIANLTLLEAKALAEYLKETHGIEAAAGGAVVMAGPAEGGAAAAGAVDADLDHGGAERFRPGATSSSRAR